MHPSWKLAANHLRKRGGVRSDSQTVGVKQGKQTTSEARKSINLPQRIPLSPRWNNAPEERSMWSLTKREVGIPSVQCEKAFTGRTVPHRSDYLCQVPRCFSLGENEWARDKRFHLPATLAMFQQSWQCRGFSDLRAISAIIAHVCVIRSPDYAFKSRRLDKRCQKCKIRE